jgi:hypothetical protein
VQAFLMDALPDFQIVDGRAVFRPSGKVSLREATALVTAAIRLARERAIGRLLVVTSGWAELPSPSVSERYEFAKEWAEAAESSIRVAVVARPQLIDHEKFGVTVARNRGLIADVFTSEEQALAWLLNDKEPRVNA